MKTINRILPVLVMLTAPLVARADIVPLPGGGTVSGRRLPATPPYADSVHLSAAVAVEGANFKVGVPKGWSTSPVRKIAPVEERGGAISVFSFYRFEDASSTQWLSFGYFRVNPERARAELVVSAFAELDFSESASQAVFPPDNVEVMVGGWREVKRSYESFRRERGVDGMRLFVAEKLDVGGASRRGLVLYLWRGIEIWKIALVFEQDETPFQTDRFPWGDAPLARGVLESFSILSKTPPDTARIQEEEETKRKMAVLLNRLLLRAVELRSEELVAGALGKGANPNFADERNITPLGMATDGTNALSSAVFRVLLEAGADPNRKWGNCGTTPFYSLVQKGCFGRPSDGELAEICESVRLMLRHGADSNKVQGMFGHSPLSYAVMRGADIALVKILVEGGGVVTDKMVEDAKDDPALQEYLKSKKKAQP